jgi:hypothetical protein
MQKIQTIEKPVIFFENQRFRQIWLWLLIMVAVISSFFTFILQIILGNDLGNRPMPDPLVFLIVLLFGIGLPVFFYLIELRTRITGHGIYLKFFPIHQKWRFIPLGDVMKFEKTTYHPIREYGGWGIRLGIHGKAYNISGNRGIRFTLSNGKELLIGTQKADEFENALENIKSGEVRSMDHSI